jgi:hypothetical protein
MTELHPIDADPKVTERIRLRAHATLAEHADDGLLARVEHAVARWIEPPLVAVFATGLLVWALRVAVVPIP